MVLMVLRVPYKLYEAIYSFVQFLIVLNILYETGMVLYKAHRTFKSVTELRVFGTIHTEIFDILQNFRRFRSMCT